MLDTFDAVKSVLGGGGSPQIKGIYGVDTQKYDWVESYLRDIKIREEIKRLQGEKSQIEASPIHKEELRKSFEETLAQAREAWAGQIREIIVNKQRRFLGASDFVTILTAKLKQPPILSSKEIDSFFSPLPDGVRQSEIEKSVQGVEDQIKQLRDKIEKELSPQWRWVHFDSGQPMHYPGGCRWTTFVQDWRKVVSRFQGNVNIEGFLCESEEEKVAFFALGLDKVRKVTPLREPRVHPPIYDVHVAYNESVHISPLKD